MIKKIAVVLVLVSFYGSCFADELLGFKGKINIVYNDVSVFRRTIDSAPVLGEGKEDYAIRIGCLGMDDCISKIPNIYRLLSTGKPISQACKKPIYAIVEIQFAAAAYGSERSDEKYKIDYSGKCLSFNGKYFKLKKSLFDFLYMSPISDW